MRVPWSITMYAVARYLVPWCQYDDAGRFSEGGHTWHSNSWQSIKGLHIVQGCWIHSREGRFTAVLRYCVTRYVAWLQWVRVNNIFLPLQIQSFCRLYIWQYLMSLGGHDWDNEVDSLCFKIYPTRRGRGHGVKWFRLHGFLVWNPESEKEPCLSTRRKETLMPCFSISDKWLGRLYEKAWAAASVFVKIASSMVTVLTICVPKWLMVAYHLSSSKFKSIWVWCGDRGPMTIFGDSNWVVRL